MNASVGKWLVLLVAAVCVGCGPKHMAAFDDYGYRNDARPYRVVANQGQLISPDWYIDNYYASGKSLEPKSAKDYLVKYEMDANDDGKPDRTEEMFLFDLRFVHKTRDAHIWLRTFPMSTRLRDKELRVLAQQYVDAVAGSGFEAVRIDNETVVGQSRRFAPHLLERGPAKVADRDAFLVTFDVVNVDEATVHSGARAIRVSVILIRPPFTYGVGTMGAGRVEFPMLMLAGYSNLPEDFAKDLDAFKDFVGRIQIGQALGYKQLSVEKVETSPNLAPAGATSASAPTTIATAAGVTSASAPTTIATAAAAPSTP